MTDNMKTTIVTIVFTVVLSCIGFFGVLKTTDATNSTKIQNIEKKVACLPDIREKAALNMQRISSQEKVVGAEINNLKQATIQLQKTTNILNVRVSENTDMNHRILNVLEKLNDNISGLNVTIARLDERLKTVEKGI